MKTISMCSTSWPASMGQRLVYEEANLDAYVGMYMLAHGF